MKIALALTGMFPLAGLIDSILARSLALISDTTHMFTDAAALTIVLAAIQIGKRPADKQRMFEYYRSKILAVTFNTLLLSGVALYVLYEAYQRLRALAEMQSLDMLGITTIGLIVNIANVRALAGSREQSLSIKGAYLEIWSNLLGSIGVIFATITTRFIGWTWVGSAITVLIGPWVPPHTWILLKSSINILLEGVLKGINLPSVEQALLTIPGARSMHDLHVWSLVSGKTSLTVYFANKPAVNPRRDTLPVARDRLVERFDIMHITVQFELRPCAQTDTVTYLRPSKPITTATSGQPDEHHDHQGRSH